MKSKNLFVAVLFVVGLMASAFALKANMAENGGCCDNICAPLCCPGH